MARFEEAFAITMDHEGGYANQPGDFGGETYRGISRRFNPHWQGWEVIDEAKDVVGTSPTTLNAYLEQNELLRLLVEDFYKYRYWNAINGDLIPSQRLANKLFDIAVNMGETRAGLFLQQALNALNRGEELWPDLVEDGKIGPKTLAALRTALARRGELLIYKVIDTLQGAYYIKRIREDPSQEKWAAGWFARLR